jgi:hypothetical protein
MMIVSSRMALTTLFAGVGFAIGFLVFLASPVLLKALGGIALQQDIVFATISGFAGAVISTVVAMAWGRRGQ